MMLVKKPTANNQQYSGTILTYDAGYKAYPTNTSGTRYAVYHTIEVLMTLVNKAYIVQSLQPTSSTHGYTATHRSAYDADYKAHTNHIPAVHTRVLLLYYT